MLIYRLPNNISLINPKRSICPNCNHTLSVFENIPLLSYLFLKGRCKYCKVNISIIYLIVELITVSITILLYIKFDLTIDFILSTILFYIFILLSFIDLKYKAVPDYLLILLVFIAFIIDDFNVVTALEFTGAIVLLELFVTFYIQNIKSRIVNDESLKDQKAMGEGDVPIVCVVGGLLGVKLGLFAIFLSAFLAIIPSILNLIFKKEKELPFIPFLTIGFIIVYFNNSFFINLIQQIILD